MTHENHAFWQNMDCFALHGLCCEVPQTGRESGKKKCRSKLRPSCRMRTLVPLGLDCLHCSAFWQLARKFLQRAGSLLDKPRNSFLYYLLYRFQNYTSVEMVYIVAVRLGKCMHNGSVLLRTSPLQYTPTPLKVCVYIT